MRLGAMPRSNSRPERYGNLRDAVVVGAASVSPVANFSKLYVKILRLTFLKVAATGTPEGFSLVNTALLRQQK